MPARPRSRGEQGEDQPRRPLTTERELIVIAAPEAQLRATDVGLASMAGVDVSSLTDALDSSDAHIRPLFGPSEERLRIELATQTRSQPMSEPNFPDLSLYYRVEAPDDRLDAIAAELRKHEAVRAAYVKPAAEPAVMAPDTVDAKQRGSEPSSTSAQALNDMLPRAGASPPISPDFSARQAYLGPAPGGIDAQYAWTQPGGNGAGVNIIDVEGEWDFTHEDLLQLQGGLVGGSPPNDLGWRNHGTAVLGEFSGDPNGMGITGISPGATVRGVSIFGPGSAGAIHRAADLLGPGDIILIELHRPGPRATGVGQQGFIAIEWWPDDYDAIRYAVGRGVVVVEAAGNGAEDLDAAIYDTPAPGFPAAWSNPFRRGSRDSGAILVGAGAPPPGTHGHDWGPDRSRLDFSNFGSAVDVQGWGREVTSTGYGDLQGGLSEDTWYTDQFSGTSSASPIVVGALGCIQGNARATGAPLTPAAARTLLRTVGSIQQDAPTRPASQRIGPRPDLRRMLGQGVATSIPLQRYWNAQATDHFYTTNWGELGSGRYGWGYEGIQCYVFPQQVLGSVPLYRYWNAQATDHFYTTNWGELGSGRYGWGYEGIQAYVFPQPGSGRIPLYRYWNPQAMDHFYTTNWNELGNGRFGWGFEGIQCYVAAQAGPPEVAGPLPVSEAVDPKAGTFTDWALGTLKTSEPLRNGDGMPAGASALPGTSFGPASLGEMNAAGGILTPGIDAMPDFAGPAPTFVVNEGLPGQGRANSFATSSGTLSSRWKRGGQSEGFTITVSFAPESKEN